VEPLISSDIQHVPRDGRLPRQAGEKTGSVMDPHSLSWIIRLVHATAMAVMLGGAVMVWAIALRLNVLLPPDRAALLRAAAAPYEWTFWGAIGVLISTGVGNLGAYGAGLPGPVTGWGEKLVVKLALVLVLLLWSLVRTVWVIRLEATTAMAISTTGRHVAQVLYAGTVVLGGAILTIAVSLAHG
jgi:hypothetical protein